MPKVSVCLPQFNRIDALKLVLNDLLTQTFTDFELIIVDDASYENTDLIIEEFNDPRIRYFKNPRNLGLYPNFNRCLELAESEYVAIYHNHDRYSKKIVEKCVRMLDTNPKVGFVHTGTISKIPGSDTPNNMVRMWPRITDGQKFAEKLIWRWDSPIHQPTVMARRELYDKVGKFDDVIFASCADSAVWLKMCLLSDVGYLPEPLMQITPRVASDRYGTFQWRNIQGMVDFHLLGFELLYGDFDPEEYQRKLRKLLFMHDRYFLINFLYCMSKGRNDWLMEGLEFIDKHGSGRCFSAARTFHALYPYIRDSLKIASLIFKKMITARTWGESLKGQILSKLRNSIL